MSSTYPTSNGHRPAVSLAAFRAYVEAERPALVAALTRDVLAQTPQYQVISDNAPEQRIDANITAYLAALEDDESLIAWTREQFGPLLARNVDLDNLLQIAAIYRQHFLGIAQRALSAGVADALEGLHRLMALVDLRARLFAQFYQERLQLFETLVEKALDGISVTDLNAKCIYFNQANAEALGYSDRSAVAGLDAAETLAPEEHDRMRNEIIPQVMRDGIWQGQNWGKRADGTRFRMRNAVVLLKDAQGRPSAFAGFMRDITAEYESEQELKRHAAAIQHASNRLKQSFESSPLATVEWDTHGLIRSWNPAAGRIFGWSAEEAIGKNIIELLVPNVALEHVQGIVDALLRGEATDGRDFNVTKDGRLITCQWYNSILHDEEGHVIGVLSQTEDISDRVRHEEELRTFQALAQNAPDGILVANIEGVIEYSNPSMRTLLGYPEGMNGIQIMNHLVGSQEYMNEIAVAMGQSGSWQGQIGYRRRDGDVVQCYASSFLVQNGAGEQASIVSIVRDMTDHIRADQERAALQEQVIAAQQAALRELSTPLIPLADHVVAMPLIGSVDSGRAQQVVETLLSGVAQYRATTAIIDITGVPVVDTQVAGALVRAAQAVELLGAQVVLTGIRPEVAQTLVGIGVSLGSVVTRSTLRDGITYALRQS